MLNLTKRGLRTWDKEKMPVAEFLERVEALRKAMKAENLDALLMGTTAYESGPVCYVSNLRGWVGEGGFLMLPAKGDVVMVSSAGGRDVAREKEMTWVTVRMGAEGGFNKDYAPPIKKVLEEWGLKEGNVGTVAVESNMPIIMYSSVKKMLDETFPKLRLRDATDLLEGIMVIKRDREVAAIKRAASLADLAYETLLKSAKAGKREFELAADIDKAQRIAGAADSVMWMATGPYAERTLRGPEDRELKNGDMILFKIAVLAESYWTEIGRTVVLGLPTKEQSDLLEASHVVQERMIKAVKPGATASHVAKTALRAAGELGYGTYVKTEYGFGHGIGLDFEEKPTITEGDITELKPGMTITASIGIHIPNVGGAFLSDTLLVTTEGCERLLKSKHEK